MKKCIAVILIMALIIVNAIPVQAAEQTYGQVFTSLRFSGTTAICELETWGNTTTDPIVATVTLKQGNTIIKQWIGLTASGYMNFSDTVEVVYGNTYTMQVTLYINGTLISVGDITRTCS